MGSDPALWCGGGGCLLQAGPKGHILNVGHGVVQGTPEENVGLFCDLARQSGSLFEGGAFGSSAKQAELVTARV